MKKIRYHYKVVSKLRADYYSAIVKIIARTEYKIGKWIRAPNWLAKKGYYLTVFRYRCHAVEFIHHNDAIQNPRIFRCLVKDPIYHHPEKCSIYNLNFGNLYRVGEKWPQGTKFYKQVKLIEKVKE